MKYDGTEERKYLKIKKKCEDFYKAIEEKQFVHESSVYTETPGFVAEDEEWFARNV